MSRFDPLRWLRRLAGGLAVAVLASGCATQVVFNFECERMINDGLLLTIDVVQISDREEEEIRQVGDEWFYSDLRRQLGSRTKTVAVEGGCRDTVAMPKLKGYGRLAIIADYQFEGRQTRAQMEFMDWQGKTMRVRVQNRYLTITGS